MEIPVRVLRPDATLPLYAHEGDAGCDLVAVESRVLAAGGGRAMVPTGLSVAIPEGHGGFVLPRSGLAAKHGVTCINAPGLIDAGYRGEVMVALVNLDPTNDYEVKAGDRIAQLVVLPVPSATFVTVEELPAATRGEGGFWEQWALTRYLDPLDSAFILLEVPGSAMNIGAVIELDFGDVADPTERYELIRKNVAARLHEIPVLTQRVIRAPFDLTWPALVPVHHIDLDRHISRVALPSPGNADQFDVLISEFFSKPLVRTRPLWQLLIIEGLEDGRVAAALKVHHALADGVSGAETFASLFDISPEVRAPAPKPEVDESAKTSASSRSLLLEGLRRLRDDPAVALRVVTSWFTRIFNVVRNVVQVSLSRGRQRSTPEQPSIFEARRTSLNGRAGVEKTYHRTRVSLVDAKRAAKHHGASVTDFVMSTTSGALRRLLADRGDVLKRDLIAFVPINVRGDGDTSEMGNQISGMLLALHTDLDDPVERLRAIAQDSAKTVGAQRRRGATMFQEMPRVLGPTVLSLGGKLVDALGLFDVVPPMANLMLSSVPGPPIPLWLSGHRVVSAAPVGPLLGPFSLNVTVLGFEENLEFGILGSAETMPDLATLRDYLKDEALALIATANS